MKFPEKPKTKKQVYLDNAATTQVDFEVQKEMEKYISESFANPSALYATGQETRKVIDQSRKTIAKILSSQTDTVVFTSGGTESNNLAIFGIARKYQNSGKHIITTRIEHPSVLEPIKQLEKQGFEVTYLKVDQNGQVNTKEFLEALREDTILVSIMYANNEIGTINQIDKIGREILKWRKNQKTQFPYFHTDACQAACTLDLSVERLHVDLLTLNGSKIYGPKGVGVLYKRRGVELEPLVFGGGQESGLRSGTENTAGIVGISKALELVEKTKKEDIKKLRDYLAQEILEKIPNTKLNGLELDSEKRLVNNLNISFAGIEAEALVLYLDEYGIMCSTGSACSTGKREKSYVLKEIGLNKENIKGSIRFTLEKNTTKEEIDYAMEYLPGVVEGLRSV